MRFKIRQLLWCLLLPSPSRRGVAGLASLHERREPPLKLVGIPTPPTLFFFSSSPCGRFNRPSTRKTWLLSARLAMQFAFLGSAVYFRKSGLCHSTVKSLVECRAPRGDSCTGAREVFSRRTAGEFGGRPHWDLCRGDGAIAGDFSSRLWATKKAAGHTKNGRDSNPKYLGAKKTHGQWVDSGQIIVKQRGTPWHAGRGVLESSDSSLQATTSGYVFFRRRGIQVRRPWPTFRRGRPGAPWLAFRRAVAAVKGTRPLRLYHSCNFVDVISPENLSAYRFPATRPLPPPIATDALSQLAQQPALCILNKIFAAKLKT
eukprot:GHVT01055943.1.p1 GENE.GHVT01055943.1~~GHVT01055943.1.p1  ORF type:complete len:316 (-),score=42.35 GHVT01055943.1:345-1292(-)